MTEKANILESTSGFDPTDFGFVYQPKIKEQGYSIYERGLETVDVSGRDFCRVNVFLSQDGPYVTVWYGVFDTIFAETALSVEDDFLEDFRTNFFERFYQGYIESPEAAKIILKSLRLERFRPSLLSRDADGKLFNGIL